MWNREGQRTERNGWVHQDDMASSPKNRFFLRQNPFFGISHVVLMEVYQSIKDCSLEQLSPLAYMEIFSCSPLFICVQSTILIS